jgi:hypothetical protein
MTEQDLDEWVSSQLERLDRENGPPPPYSGRKISSEENDMGYDMRWRKRDEGEATAVQAAQDQFNAAVGQRDTLPASEKGMINWERAKASGDFDSQDNYDGRSPRYRAAQDKVHAAYQALREAERSYFRLNGSGMGWAYSVMEQFGMVFDDPSERPEWPKPEDYGTSYDDVDALESPEYYPGKQWDDEALRAAVAYKQEQDKVLSWHGVEIPGIPLHKFSSNDGWIVLPAEAEAAVRIWKQAYDEMGEDAARDAVALAGDRIDSAQATPERADAYWSLWLRWVAYLAGSVTRGGFEVH